MRSNVAEVAGLCECGCGETTRVSKVNNRLYGWRKGEHVRFRPGHNSKLKSPGRYPGISIGNGRSAFFHRIRAEHALGKPLPNGAVVHHADGSKDIDAPLVICQDHAYHMLLHRRMRVKVAGGNPNTDRMCSRHQSPQPIEAFGCFKYGPDGLSEYCRSCWNAMKRSGKEAPL